MIKAYTALWAILTASITVKPKTHILDKEASAEFKREIQKNCTIQLVPTDNHRQNLAERAIHIIKNHFKSILAGSMTLSRWDYGIDSSHKQYWHWTSSDNPTRYRWYWHGNMYTEILTTTKCHWHQWDVWSKYTKAVRYKHHGEQMQLTDCTFKCHQSTTNATWYM